MNVYVDEKPEAGKILNHRGEVIKIVRHGPEKVPFGFTAPEKEETLESLLEGC